MRKPRASPEEIEKNWNDSETDKWQRSEEIVEALGAKSSVTVGEIGAGTAYMVVGHKD